jgi:hypothetical protein
MRNKPMTPYRPPDSRGSPERKEPEPTLAPGFGTTLYDLICRHRLPDGSAWTIRYFATVVGAREDQVRAWLAGTRPDPQMVDRIAQALMVDSDALLEGEVRPPSLHPAERTTGEFPTIPGSGDDS